MMKMNTIESTIAPVVSPTGTPPLYGNPVGDFVIAGFRVGDYLVRREVQIGAAIAGILIIVLGIIVLLSRGRKKKKQMNEQQETSANGTVTYIDSKVIPAVTQSGNAADGDGEKTIDVYGRQGISHPYGGGDEEKTINPYGGENEEKTINPYGGGDGEETINPYSGGDGEETVNPYGEGDGEETLAPDWTPQTILRFSVDTQDDRYEQEVAFTDKMEIGRDAGCELCLKPKYISRHHLELTALTDGVYERSLCVRNLSAEKSKKYTRLNHEEVGDAELKVNSGDVLEIAQTKIVITIVNL